jgi:hypothetical protein
LDLRCVSAGHCVGFWDLCGGKLKFVCVRGGDKCLWVCNVLFV